MQNGVLGQIMTPGSVIYSTLDKVLGAQQDQVVRMGDVSGQVNSILGNIATVFNTVNFAGQLLGGNSSGGLLSAGAPSPANASAALQQYQNSSTMGITQAGVVQATAASNPDPSVTGASVTNNVSQYQAAWSSIGSAANTAASSVSSLASSCTAAANKAALDIWTKQNLNDGAATTTTPTQAQLDAIHSSFIDAARAQAAAVPGVYTTEIAPVIAQASSNTAPGAFADTVAMAQRVQNDIATGNTAYASDLSALQLMPPSQSDVATAQFNATALQAAQATPQGSLTVPGSSSVPIIDQMNLISSNANALVGSVCTYNAFGSFL